MNYGDDDADHKHQAKEKTYLSENRKVTMKRNEQSYQKYMDVMSASLNQNMIDNIKPYWRDHQSNKGKFFITVCKYSLFRLVVDELPNGDAEPSFEEKRDKERKGGTI